MTNAEGFKILSIKPRCEISYDLDESLRDLCIASSMLVVVDESAADPLSYLHNSKVIICSISTVCICFWLGRYLLELITKYLMR